MTGRSRLHPDDVAAIADLITTVSGAPALLTSAEAGALLGVPRTWVEAEARRDRIPHVRLGRYVRFDRDQLLAWVAGRTRGPRRTGSGPVSSDRKTA